MVSSASVTERRPHLRALDGLRGVAAVVVVLLHMEWPNHVSDTIFIQHGYLAVDLFFILSGLVISLNYANRIRNFRDIKAFLCLRFFRLYPLHISVLFALLVLEFAKLFVEQTFAIKPENPPFTGSDSYEALVASILLIQGLHLFTIASWNGPSWSISCEFAVYLLFVVPAMAGLTRNKLFSAGALLAAGGIYIVLALDRHTLDVVYDWGILRCIAGFLLGMLVSNLAPRNFFGQSTTLAAAFQVVITIVILLTMSFASGWTVVFVIPLFTIVIALLRSDQGPIARLLSLASTQFLGRISYSIYMVHGLLIVLVVIILKRTFPTSIDPSTGNKVIAMSPWIGDFLAIAVLVGVVASVAETYAFIEEPGRLFGRWLVAASDKRESGRLRPSPRNV